MISFLPYMPSAQKVWYFYDDATGKPTKTPQKRLKDLMKHTSCVNTTDLVDLYQMLHEQLLNYYKNKMLASNHKINITFDQ